MKLFDPRDPIPSSVLATVALCLWVTFFVLGYIAGINPGTPISFVVAITALTDGVLAVGFTLFTIYRFVREQLNKPK